MLSFRWDRPLFFGQFVRKSSKQLHTIQNDADHVSEKIKSCFFISIRYHKTSQTQDVKSQSTKSSVQKIAQPNRDSAFEQKTPIVPNRESSGSSQNIFFSYNQRKKQSRAQTDIFGTYSTSFWKVGVVLSVISPITFRTVCTKFIKTIAHNPKRRRPRFRKYQKLFFLSIRYPKTSQTQDVESQSTERSVRGKIAQPKRDSAFQQKTRVVPSRETSRSSQIIFFIYNQRKKQSRAQTDIFGTYSTSFWKVCVVLSVRSPTIFRTVCTKIIKTIAHNPKRRRPRFRKNQKLFFYKYSISQGISNAGCKEPKY